MTETCFQNIGRKVQLKNDRKNQVLYLITPEIMEFLVGQYLTILSFSIMTVFLFTESEGILELKILLFCLNIGKFQRKLRRNC